MTTFLETPVTSSFQAVTSTSVQLPATPAYSTRIICLGVYPKTANVNPVTGWDVVSSHAHATADMRMVTLRRVSEVSASASSIGVTFTAAASGVAISTNATGELADGTIVLDVSVGGVTSWSLRQVALGPRSSGRIDFLLANDQRTFNTTNATGYVQTNTIGVAGASALSMLMLSNASGQPGDVLDGPAIAVRNLSNASATSSLIHVTVQVRPMGSPAITAYGRYSLTAATTRSAGAVQSVTVRQMANATRLANENLDIAFPQRTQEGSMVIVFFSGIVDSNAELFASFYDDSTYNHDGPSGWTGGMQFTPRPDNKYHSFGFARTIHKLSMAKVRLRGLVAGRVTLTALELTGVAGGTRFSNFAASITFSPSYTYARQTELWASRYSVMLVATAPSTQNVTCTVGGTSPMTVLSERKPTATDCGLFLHHSQTSTYVGEPRSFPITVAPSSTAAGAVLGDIEVITSGSTIEFTLDPDVNASTDISYSVHALATGRLLGNSVWAGIVPALASAVNSSGNFVVQIAEPSGYVLPDPTYYIVLQGSKGDRKWGTGRLLATKLTPTSPAPTPPAPTPTPPAPTPPAPTPTPPAPTPPAPTPAYVAPYGKTAAEYPALTFEDHFLGSSYDTRKWITVEPWWGGTGGLTDNFAIEDSKLKIWQGRFPDGRFEVRNRAFNTYGKFYQKYGYFEVYAKLPWGIGNWPSFWLYNYDHINTNRPEIDIMEAYTGGGAASWWTDAAYKPNNYASTVWLDPNVGPVRIYKLRDTLAPNGVRLDNSFHYYGCRWDPTGVEFYFDGQLMGPRIPITTAMSATDMVIIIAMGPGDEARPTAGIPTQATVNSGLTVANKTNSYEVDYVRAWSLPGNITTVRGSAAGLIGTTPAPTPTPPAPTPPAPTPTPPPAAVAPAVIGNAKVGYFTGSSASITQAAATASGQRQLLIVNMMYNTTITSGLGGMSLIWESATARGDGNSRTRIYELTTTGAVAEATRTLALSEWTQGSYVTLTVRGTREYTFSNPVAQHTTLANQPPASSITTTKANSLGLYVIANGTYPRTYTAPSGYTRIANVYHPGSVSIGVAQATINAGTVAVPAWGVGDPWNPGSTTIGDAWRVITLSYVGT